MEQTPKKDTGTNTFPWLFSVLNGLSLLLVWWAGWKVDAVLYGNDAEPFLFLFFTSIIVFILWLASLVFQCVVYAICKRHIKRQSGWFLLFMLPAITFSIAFGKFIHHQCQPHAKASGILSIRHLAELPKSASEIKVWRTQYHDYLRFHAYPGDIEDFLKASSYLNNNKHVGCEVYSSTRKRLEGSPDPKLEDGDSLEDAVYFNNHHHTPDWYDGSLEESGRVYAEYGFELIVNDKKNTVFLHLEH